MTDDEVFEYAVNSSVIALSPAVSMGSNMLALASSMAREYSNATNQQQLNHMMAMVAAMQNSGGGRPCGDSRAVDEAMGLLKQVLAAVQAN
ncbi:RebB family R body protein [Allosphingosinicella humi]|jgi:hypothetical protein